MSVKDNDQRESIITEAHLVSRVLLLVLGLLAAYATFFGVLQQLKLGGPESWAQFGDFFGGVVNPLVGLVTVILVVRTLKTTREEAAATRAQFALQLRHLEQDRTLSDMKHRLEMVLLDWSRAMEIPIPVIFTAKTKTGYAFLRGRSRGEIIGTPRLLESLTEIVALPESVDRAQALKSWDDSFRGVVPLLLELSSYCTSYGELTGSSVLTGYYHRRVLTAARVLHVVGLLSDAQAQAVEPYPLSLERMNWYSGFSRPPFTGAKPVDAAEPAEPA